jgi:hypothetical protein
MELLETARVDAYSQNDVIVPASRRSKLLCVVWEGTCSEKKAVKPHRGTSDTRPVNSSEEDNETIAVWHAGDWTGPISLQPDRALSGESGNSKTHDIVAVAYEGVKVITVEFSSLHTILKNGSSLYKKYLERKSNQERVLMDISSGSGHSSSTGKLLDNAMRDLNVLELLNCNSALRKLDAVQKRHLESLAEGPISFHPGERMWQAGAPVDRAFVIVSGTASFHVRRNAGSIAGGKGSLESSEVDRNSGTGDSMRVDAMKVIKELNKYSQGSPAHGDDHSSMSSIDTEENRPFPLDIFGHTGPATSNQASFSDSRDFEALQRGLKARAKHLSKDDEVGEEVSHEDESLDAENESQLDHTFTDEFDPGTRSRRSSVIKRRGSRARFANKVLGRLYNRRAFTSGLVFSRGHFLGDVSKMVAGLLASDCLPESNEDGPSYGFGDKKEGDDDKRVGKIAELTIHEQEGDHHILHSSTLTAGQNGCVALVFPKSSIIPFLDAYPGFLLSLLGTQVVV